MMDCGSRSDQRHYLLAESTVDNPRILWAAELRFAFYHSVGTTVAGVGRLGAASRYITCLSTQDPRASRNQQTLQAAPQQGASA